MQHLSLLKETLIDPAGIKWLRDTNFSDFVSIYVDCSEENKLERGITRGDDIESLKSCLSCERDDWDNFRDTKCYDYIIDNNGTYTELCLNVDKIIFNILNK